MISIGMSMLLTLFTSMPSPDSHRQRIINWIDGTGQLSTAFDFTTKGILQVFGRTLSAKTLEIRFQPSRIVERKMKFSRFKKKKEREYGD